VTGAVGYHAGRCAEAIAAGQYLRQGWQLRQERWRGHGGEIDLILEKSGVTVFVEVKKSVDFATAAARLSARQRGRIYAAAGGYLAQLPGGQDSESRIDVALVNGVGAVEIIENAFGQ